MYIKYSTRRFKEDHLNRIRALKKQYLSQGIEKTQEQILVQVVGEGLQVVEQLIMPQLTAQFAGQLAKRVAPLGIKDDI